MAGLHRAAIGQQYGALHKILQFAHIAGKLILFQPDHRGFAQGHGRQIVLAHVHVHEKTGQFQHVVPAFAQGGQAQRDDVEPEIQVLTEFALFDPVLQIAVGGGQHAHVHPHCFRAAHPVDLAFLKHAQQLGLEGHIHF